MIILTINYTDGTTDEIAIDDYTEGKQCLKYYIRFGQNEGEYNIPFSRIKSWKVKR